VLEVGDDQLLVLLLVVQAQLDHVQRRHRQRRAREQLRHASIDVGAVAPYLVQPGAREHAALRARELFAQGVVIGIEEVAEIGMKGLVARGMALEHEGLEKPGRMRHMPFHRARVGHGLRGAVLRRQALRQGRRLGAHPAVLEREIRLLDPAVGFHGPWSFPRARPYRLTIPSESA
jgi:hypothetical protein